MEVFINLRNPITGKSITYDDVPAVVSTIAADADSIGSDNINADIMIKTEYNIIKLFNIQLFILDDMGNMDDIDSRINSFHDLFDGKTREGIHIGGDIAMPICMFNEDGILKIRTSRHPNYSNDTTIDCEFTCPLDSFRDKFMECLTYAKLLVDAYHECDSE